MKNNELRRGNLVNHGEVNIIHDDHIYVKGDAWAKKDWEPIPLTEEWLLKFGFEKELGTQIWVNRISDCMPTEIDYCWTKCNTTLFKAVGVDGLCTIIRNEIYSDFDCEFVHDLQNLYFTENREELCDRK